MSTVSGSGNRQALRTIRETVSNEPDPKRRKISEGQNKISHVGKETLKTPQLGEVTESFEISEESTDTSAQNVQKTSFQILSSTERELLVASINSLQEAIGKSNNLLQLKELKLALYKQQKQLALNDNRWLSNTYYAKVTELEQMRAQLDAAEEANRKMKAIYENKVAGLQGIREEPIKGNEDVPVRVKELSSGNEVKLLKREITKQSKTIQSLRDLNHDLQAFKDFMTTKQSTVTRSAKSENEKELQKKLAGKDKEIGALHEELETLKGSVKWYQEENGKLRDGWDELKKKVRTQKEVNNNYRILSEQHDQVKQQNTHLGKERDELKRKCEELTGSLQNINETHKKKIEQIKSDLFESLLKKFN